MAYNGIYVDHGRNVKRPKAINVGLYSPGGGVLYASFLGFVDFKHNSVKLYPNDWQASSFYETHEISLYDLKSKETWERIRENYQITQRIENVKGTN